MANGMTSWGSGNLVIETDYGVRFNEIVVGNPEIAVEPPTTSGGSPVVSVASWYHFQCAEAARWKYVGMDYDTAKSCANAMRAGLTFSIPVWDYGQYVDNGQLLYGYHVGSSEPQLASNVAVQKEGNGALYFVEVDARVTSEAFSRNPNMYSSLSTRLKTYLGNLTGWSTYPSGWSNGISQPSASASNMVLVQAPSVSRKFEIAGSDVQGASAADWQTMSLPVWYKYTDTYSCQIKYTGMTRNACTALANSLNTTTGWYLPVHPWVYDYNTSTNTFFWSQNTNVTTYQCLNDFHAVKSNANMWTAELSLCVEDVGYMLSTDSAPSFSWPAIWSTKIPGLSAFL